MTRVKWVEPQYAASGATWLQSADELPYVERCYATALEHEEQCLESCVDLFFEVAVGTLDHQVPVKAGGRAGCGCGEPEPCRQHQLHKSALNKLVVNGQRFGRLDPRSRLLVRQGGSELLIPIAHRGFVWQASDFHALVPIGNYKTNGLRTLYQQDGVGVPLVVTGCRPDDGTFVVRRPTFAATLRLSNADCGACAKQDSDRPASSYRIELYDPLRIDRIAVRGTPQAIAKDLSAPLVYRLRNDPQSIINDFINPNSASSVTELRTVEPYRPGTIPVVFIHGLLSNPYTWIEMINQLRAYPGFLQHFQIWVVVYPTGQPFLTSAAQCRAQLRQARQTFDPSGTDAQLSNIVLVGHSLGGLVCKLQVTSSGQSLWRSVSNRPFEEISIPAGLRQTLHDAFFFEPSPDVTRVVYLGTPHRGSGFANRFIGRLGSTLVREPETRANAHAELIRRNPGVFRPAIRKRIPTSIDLLEPDSELLNAMAQLPAKGGVRMHSIIGDSCYTLFNGKSDGVVSVRSARDRRAVSERFIHTPHTRLTGHPQAVEEIVCILRQHLQETANQCQHPTTAELDLEFLDDPRERPAVVPTEALQVAPAREPNQPHLSN